ncbi:MAG: hypothetical protein ABI222_15780, partial [Opitutaceae bacterium]
MDWTKSPLGPVAGWPLTLRAQVWNCLNNRFPTCIWWGADLTMIYNDAYAPIFGRRDAIALGNSARVIWADTWSVVAVQVQAALERGESTWNYR